MKDEYKALLTVIIMIFVPICVLYLCIKYSTLIPVTVLAIIMLYIVVLHEIKDEG